MKWQRQNSNLTICVIDDDPISLFLTEYTIRDTGLNISLDTFDCPAVALRHFLSEDTCWPDVILLDINMPLVSGWMLLDNLNHKLSTAGKNTSIYMLSSSQHPSDIEEFERRPVVQDYLHKPLDPVDLYKVLEISKKVQMIEV